MDIKIPESFNVQNRTRNIGSELELNKDDLSSDKGTEHPLFIYMLKYLMAPLTENLGTHSKGMRVLLDAEGLENAARYNAGMDVDSEEYIKHINHAWNTLSKSSMYSTQKIKDEDNQSYGVVEKGILGILNNQKWIEQEDKEVIEKLIQIMPKEGQETSFIDLLDLEEKQKKVIGTEGQKKIFGYRTGKKASEMYASGEQGKPYYPILKLLEEVVETSESADNKIIKRGKIEDKVVIEYLRKVKTSKWEGENVTLRQDIVIHFDRLFQILRNRYGIGNVKSDSKNAKPIKTDNVETLLKEDTEDTKVVPLANNQIEPNAQYDVWERQNNITKPENLSDIEEHLFRRIILKLELEKQQQSRDIQASLIHHLYKYNIIDNLSDDDELGQYSDMLTQHSKGKWRDKYGKIDFPFTNDELDLIEKIVDTEELTEPMKKLKAQTLTRTLAAENERAAKEKKLSSRPVIQRGESGIFDRIADPTLTSINLRDVRSGEFRTELLKAITPGTEGKLRFSYGQITDRNREGLILLDITFTPYVKILGYADYQGDTYSVRSGKDSKFIPSNMDNLSANLIAEGKNRSYYLQNIKGASIFLYSWKKQLSRLNRMVQKYVKT